MALKSYNGPKWSTMPLLTQTTPPDGPESEDCYDPTLMSKRAHRPAGRW